MANRKKRKKRTSRSLFRRFYSIAAVTISIAMIALSTTMTVIIAAQWWNDKTEEMKTNAHQIADEITKNEGFDFDDAAFRKDISKMINTVSNATDSMFFITDTEGDVLICKDSKGETAYELEDDPHYKLKIDSGYMERALSNGFSEYSTSKTFGFGQFVLARPITVNDKTVAVIFAIEDAVTGLVPYIFNTVQFSFFATIVILIVCYLIIYTTCKKITVPIEEMADLTVHIARGEFDIKAREDYMDGYLNEFAKSLNKMSRELEIENEAQRSFVANVSHELKTPMTSIGGFIDGILDGTIPREKEKEYLTIVSGEIKRLSRMVVSMLNLSKIESGEVSISPTEYNVVNQLFETLLSFEKRINDKRVEIIGFEDMQNVKIKADRDLLQQVIYNLLDNAVKFVDEGGTISLFAEYTDDERTRVIIRNTGKGISKEEISRIFERFYKVDKSRSFDTKGVGLGLYIVKTIINMHEGEISTTSEEGKYTQFEFII